MTGPAVLCLILVLIVGLVAFGEESPAMYANARDNELRDTESRLSDVKLFAEHDRAGIAYVVRAERDVYLCRQVLYAFKREHVDRKHVEQLFRQLRRDMAEFPPKEVE